MIEFYSRYDVGFTRHKISMLSAIEAKWGFTFCDILYIAFVPKTPAFALAREAS
jgi:hypothetical protein